MPDLAPQRARRPLVPVAMPMAVAVACGRFVLLGHDGIHLALGEAAPFLTAREHTVANYLRKHADAQVGEWRGTVAPVHTTLPEFDMPADEQVHLAAESFRMLADPTRIKVLWALLHGESSVACLAELAGASPTAVSQHLAKLRLAGLVTGRREGTFVYYSAANDHVQSLLAQALFHADHVDRAIPADDTTPHVHAPVRPAPSSGKS